MATMNGNILRDGFLDELRDQLSKHELRIDATLAAHIREVEAALANNRGRVSAVYSPSRFSSCSPRSPNKPGILDEPRASNASSVPDMVVATTTGKSNLRTENEDQQKKESTRTSRSKSIKPRDIQSMEGDIQAMQSKNKKKTVANGGMGTIARLVAHPYFEIGSVALVLGNAVQIGVAADFAMKAPHADSPTALWAMDVFFTVAFSLELLLRIVTERKKFMSCQNKDVVWNLFDTFLVTSAVTELLLDLFAAEIIDLSGARILRLLKMVRILRAVRILRFFSDLRVMVLSVIGSAKPFFFAMLLLFIIIYIFAVGGLQLLVGAEVANVEKFYGSLGQAIYTLFLSISGGVSWIESAQPLIDMDPFLGFVFCLYVSFSCFCVLNIVTGIFVDNASRLTSLDESHMLMQEIEQRKQWLAEVRQQFEMADTDGSGDMGLPEFKASMENALVQVRLKSLGFDVAALEPSMLFQMFDMDGNGTVDINEFATSLQFLHGPASAIELAHVKHTLNGINSALNGINSAVYKLHAFSAEHQKALKLHAMDSVFPSSL